MSRLVELLCYIVYRLMEIQTCSQRCHHCSYNLIQTSNVTKCAPKGVNRSVERLQVVVNKVTKKQAGLHVSSSRGLILFVNVQEIFLYFSYTVNFNCQVVVAS